MNMEKEHKENGNSNSNRLLIYVVCPILVILSAAAIIYTFKELPKISVLRNQFVSHEEQFQKHSESQAEDLKKIKKSIAKLAQATGNLDSEMIEDLLSKLNKIEKDWKDWYAHKPTKDKPFF